MDAPANIRHETMRLAWDDGARDRRIEVLNPWNGAIVGSVPCASAEDVRRSFEVAAAYEPTLSRGERAEILTRTAEIIRGRREEIADLITAECGISKKDSLYESGRSTDVFTLAAKLAILDDGEAFSCDITPGGKQRRIFTLRQPVRAISAITPFNHPLNQVAHKIAPAVAAGACMVLKPTEKTPLTALLLADVLFEAGLPREMLQIVTGEPAEIGPAMVADPAAEVVTFTGGVAVGKLIAETAGYRRLVLELGGNDPLIVMADADLEKAAELAVAGATKNSGQRCTAVKRILCVDAVADAFARLVVEKTAKLVCGDPMDPATDIGTVIDEDAARLFEARVADACARGAEKLLGAPRQGALFPPTVLDRVPADCELVREETFGPIVPILRVPDDVERIIEISNSTAYGLSSGVCTNRLDHVTRFVHGLDVGTVNVWEVPGFRIEMSPFGGVKDSGLGYKEGVLEAMKSFTNVKTFSLPWGA